MEDKPPRVSLSVPVLWACLPAGSGAPSDPVVDGYWDGTQQAGHLDAAGNGSLGHEAGKSAQAGAFTFDPKELNWGGEQAPGFEFESGWTEAAGVGGGWQHEAIPAAGAGGDDAGGANVFALPAPHSPGLANHAGQQDSALASDWNEQQAQGQGLAAQNNLALSPTGGVSAALALGSAHPLAPQPWGTLTAPGPLPYPTQPPLPQNVHQTLPSAPGPPLHGVGGQAPPVAPRPAPGHGAGQVPGQAPTHPASTPMNSLGPTVQPAHSPVMPLTHGLAPGAVFQSFAPPAPGTWNQAPQPQAHGMNAMLPAPASAWPHPIPLPPAATPLGPGAVQNKAPAPSNVAAAAGTGAGVLAPPTFDDGLPSAWTSASQLEAYHALLVSAVDTVWPSCHGSLGGAAAKGGPGTGGGSGGGQQVQLEPLVCNAVAKKAVETGVQYHLGRLPSPLEGFQAPGETGGVVSEPEAFVTLLQAADQEVLDAWRAAAATARSGGAGGGSCAAEAHNRAAELLSGGAAAVGRLIEEWHRQQPELRDRAVPLLQLLTVHAPDPGAADGSGGGGGGPGAGGGEVLTVVRLDVAGLLDVAAAIQMADELAADLLG